MELHQLRYFLAVVDEGTFTAAAAALRISQSGVSTQIQKLERELGITLVDRTSRRVTLTRAGARLVPYARSAAQAVDDVTSAAGDIRGLVVGSLRVGTVTGLVWDRLFDALTAMHAEHQGVDIRLREGDSAELAGRVRDGALDLGVVAWADSEPEGLESAVVYDDRLVAVVARSHSWAARTELRPAELVGTDVIAMPRGTGSRAAFDALMARSGASDQVRWEVATPTAVQRLATRGLGVGIVSETTASEWSDVVRLGIRDPRARSRLGLVWRRRPSHAVAAVLRELLDSPNESDAAS